MPCNYVPDHPPGKNITTVYGPEGTLHEALFDPVDGDGDTVGISADNGNLKSDAFTVDGSEIQVDRIDWSAGNVEMQITPHNALADHNVDFIALDGSVSLRLDFDDALVVTETDGSQTLSWGVCEQPWKVGDKLMIRISVSGVDLTGTTNDAECAATPVAGEPVTPTPTP